MPSLQLMTPPQPQRTFTCEFGRPRRQVRAWVRACVRVCMHGGGEKEMAFGHTHIGGIIARHGRMGAVDDDNELQRSLSMRRDAQALENASTKRGL